MPQTSTSKWVEAKMPMDWNKVYKDKKRFEIAWNAIVLEFSDELIGKKFSFVWGGIAPKYHFYLDGQLVDEQNKYSPHKPLKMINPNINTFKVTKKKHTLSFRHKNYVMKAFYGLPFELREFKVDDKFLSFIDFIFKDLVDIGSISFLVSFLFFGLVYFNTRNSFYVIPCLISLSTGVAFSFWGGLFAKFFDYYEGVVWLYLTIFPPLFLSLLFMARFIKIKKVFFILPGISVLCAFIMPTLFIGEFNQNLFLVLRKVGLAAVVLGSFFNNYFAFMLFLKDKTKLPLFLGVSISTLAAFQSSYAAIKVGYITMHIGFIFLTFGIVYLAVKNFAKTYMDNEVLLAETKELNENLESKVEERTAELAEEKNSVSNLLHNMSQAVFSVNMYGEIQGRAMSEFSNEVFGQAIKGLSVYDILFNKIDRKSEKFGDIKSALETSIGGNDLQWDLNNDYFPRKVDVDIQGQGRIFSILPNPIWDLNEECVEIMFTCEDITEKLAFEAEVAKKQAESNKRSKLLHELAPSDGKGIAAHSKDLKMFLGNSNDITNESIEIMSHLENVNEDGFNTVFRHLHTIKGNARGFGASLISESVHRSESHLEIIKSDFANFDDEKRQRILEELNITREILDDFIKVAEEVFSISLDGSSGDVIYKEVHRDNISALSKAIEDAVGSNPSEAFQEVMKNFENLLKTPLKDFLNGFKKIVEETATESGKAVEFKVEGDDIYITNDELSLLNDSLIHLVRNSVDHGIETSENRAANKKSDKGLVTIKCVQNGKGYSIHVKDDGAGINADKVSKIALEKGIITKEDLESMNDSEKLKLIFRPGFSTKEEVTELSGRGVGMDVVLTNISKLKGDINIETKEGIGTEFLMTINPE
jgi:signal transduction histidine kinase